MPQPSNPLLQKLMTDTYLTEKRLVSQPVVTERQLMTFRDMRINFQIIKDALIVIDELQAKYEGYNGK